MKKKIIYRDQHTIDRTIELYKQAAPQLQRTIDELKAEGVTLTDESIFDLMKGGAATRARIETDIKNEVGKLRFMVLKKELQATLAPLLEKVTEVVKKANSAMVYSGATELIALDPADITCVNLTVGLVPDLEARITDRHTLYHGADPAIDEAYRLAGEVCDKLNGLEAYLREHGDALYPVSRDGVMIRGEVIAYPTPGLIRIGSQGGAYAELSNHAFGSIHWRQP